LWVLDLLLLSLVCRLLPLLRLGVPWSQLLLPQKGKLLPLLLLPALVVFLDAAEELLQQNKRRSSVLFEDLKLRRFRENLCI
jgi:hypothetical protein